MKNQNVTEWVVLTYRQDKTGMTRKTKVGKAFRKRDDVINVILDALPIVNHHGECWVTLVPFNPDFVEDDDE